MSEKARLWTEESLRWLHGEFGDNALRGEVLRPETVFPPGSFTGSEDDVSVVLRRLCDRMGVPIESVDIEFDEAWYCREYMDAALEISEGWFAGALEHYLEIGMRRGYRPSTCPIPMMP